MAQHIANLSQRFRGYCAKTEQSQVGDCSTSEKGVLQPPLQGSEWIGLHAVRAACAARCLRCERCQYFSFSLAWQDCSWFAACDVRLLHQDVHGFYTAARPALPPVSSASHVPMESHAPQQWVDARSLLLAPSSILLTVTTFLALPQKIATLAQALTTLYETRSLECDCLVVNEYPPPDGFTMQATLARDFPMCTFMQKRREDRGQARSLNMILERLRLQRYKYWVQWEEAWFSTRPWLQDALHEMERYPDIDQLALHNNQNFHRRERSGRGFQHVQRGSHVIVTMDSTDGLRQMTCWDGHFTHWPLFSLQPAVNKVASILSNGAFNESADMWPVHFEFTFGVRWLLGGAIKARLKPGGAAKSACCTSQRTRNRHIGDPSRWF